MVVFVEVFVSLTGHIVAFMQGIITILPEEQTKARPETTKPDEEQDAKDDGFKHCSTPQL